MPLYPHSPVTASGCHSHLVHTQLTKQQELQQQDPIAMYMEDIYTLAVNLAGLPGLSTPAGLIDGMPVGLQLIGKPFEEQTILNAAFRLQTDTDWHLACPNLASLSS